ncbi:hypothetical protein CcaverHIS631_0405190 [Cutaneotrichosporon cavernicola]|nr:hypothetical protein CcaverHIS631_0405190 [Cutaneotrichosporon cavernicola]BEJ07254.1 hypothetical protein CcaverHIS641_0405230 [Cutaneotrichosporon cavernicola]
MEDGRASTTNGELTGADLPGDTPRAAAFTALSGGRLLPNNVPAAANESAIASLLPPDIQDGLSESGSRRSSMQPRVPSRQLLQTALDLAQKAVEMDKNNDVAGALASYREAVSKLRVVMERVGVDPTSDGKRGGKNEEEGRTLRGIHDAYMARITLLSAYESPPDGDDGAAALALTNLTLDSSVSSAATTPPNHLARLNTNTEDSPNNNSDAGPSTPQRSPALSSISGRRQRSVDGADESEDTSIKDGLAPTDTSSRASNDEDDRPLPPLPASLVSSKGASENNPQSYLINSTTAQGTINQRRNNGTPSMTSISELNASTSSEGNPDGSVRKRTVSLRGLNGDSASEMYVAAPLQAAFKSTLAPPARLSGTAHLSMRPDPQPAEIAHRPFHILRLLSTSMDASGTGAYITSSIHIDPGVWRAGNLRSGGMSKSISGAKVIGIEAKTRVCEALVGHLEAIKSVGNVFLDGQREERHGVDVSSRLTKAQIDQIARIGDELGGLLDGLDDELDSTYKALAGKGVISSGAWNGKAKTSWGSRISARVDKMSRGSDSGERYVDILGQLFYAAQVIDDHLRCFTGPCTAAYHALPHKTYKQIETRITRAAQFFGAVIVPFVLEDLRQFMLGYLKGGLQYLED